MTDPTPPATAPARCYLLELPGELRNRIYDYVLDHYEEYSDSVMKTRRYIGFSRPPFTPWYNKRCPGHEECQWSELGRPSLGLTQTCRTIRREFRPLHFSRLIVYHHYGFDEVARYIAHFFPEAQDACEMLPFIQLLSKARNLTLKYQISSRDEFNIAALNDVKENKRWREYVEKNVTRISYFTDSRSIVKPPKNQLFVCIRHTVGEPWMIEEETKEDTSDEWILMRNKTPANKPECVKRWLEFAGIPHLDDTLDDVGIQVAPADEDSESDTSSIEDS